MNTIYEDHLRVTSIPFSSNKFVIFTGVPIKKNSYKINSGKYYVTIKTTPENIPVPPSIGQHWVVKGTREVKDVNTHRLDLKN